MVETICLAHLPSELPIYAILFKDVTNTAFLKEQLLAGNAEFEYAFIDAAMVVSRKHALSAAFRALNDYLHARLKSKNIHSEMVFALNPTNNIGDAFRRFGIGDTTTHLLVLKVATGPEVDADSVERHLSAHVRAGEVVAFDDWQLEKLRNVPRIRKAYKLTASASASAAGVRKSVNGDGPSYIDETQELETQVLGLMALRGAT